MADPMDYTDTLTLWLGEQEGCLPILMTGVGTRFIYRRLSETTDGMCLLDIHYRRSGSFAASFSDFLSASSPANSLRSKFSAQNCSGKQPRNTAASQPVKSFSSLPLWPWVGRNPFHMSKKEMPQFISICFLNWAQTTLLTQSREMRGHRFTKPTPTPLNWRAAAS